MPDQPPKGTRRVALPHSVQPAPARSIVAGKTPADQKLKVSVIVRRKQPLKLEDLAGRRVSRAEFADKYAADAESFGQIRTFAAEHGLEVDEAASSLERRTVVLEGTVAALEKAFGISLEDYELDGHRYHSYRGTLSIPEEHSGVIEAVLGLNTKPIAKPHFRSRETGRRATTPNLSYTPPQVAQIYNFPTDVDGSGETVGILEFGGGFSTTDLATYFQKLGIEEPSVTAVSVDGTTNSPGNPSGADGEVMLDIEVIGSVAPGAKIAVYFAPNTEQGFVDSVTTAVHDTANSPSVLSISWGGPEDSWSQQTVTALDDAFQSAGALGITVTIASGDNGSSDGESDGNHVDFPASSPHALGCGGTTLVAQNDQRQSEVVWNDQASGGGATGGGVSVLFPLPSWQADANVPAPTAAGGGRGVPDVAGNASPETGYQILVDGQSQVIGGTSAVAPLWAALVALVNQKRGSSMGFINQSLYQSGEADFYDITNGNNGAFRASKGWDACTGLGAPVGNLLESLLAAAQAKLR